MRRRVHYSSVAGPNAAAGFVLPVTVILLALIAVGVALMSHITGTGCTATAIVAAFAGAAHATAISQQSEERILG